MNQYICYDLKQLWLYKFKYSYNYYFELEDEIKDDMAEIIIWASNKEGVGKQLREGSFDNLWESIKQMIDCEQFHYNEITAVSSDYEPRFLFNLPKKWKEIFKERLFNHDDYFSDYFYEHNFKKDLEKLSNLEIYQFLEQDIEWISLFDSEIGKMKFCGFWSKK